MPLRQLHSGSLRRFWACGVRNPWLLALSAGMIVVIWRGILVLGPSRGVGVAMVIHFIGLAVTPFLFLRQEGRRIIGLTSGLSRAWAGIAILCGVVAGVVIGVLGMWWYGESDHNWFVTVRDTMLRDARLRALEGLRLFAALAVPAAIFSPIGEELFFRGVFASFVTMAAGPLAAAVWTAAVFGLVHVFHHGVAMGPTGLEIQPVSAMAWVLLTAGLSLLFTWLRTQSGSIWSAVCCHAAFNVTMVAFIVIVLT
jgi:membrane protease YdiL (CAAX protease family)